MDPTITETARLSKTALFRVIGYEPHPGQVLVHRSRAQRRVLACGVRWGKTTCGVGEAVAALLEPREFALGWVVAPSYDLADKTFRQVADAIQTHFRPRVQVLDLRGQRIVVSNLGGGTSELRGKSADQPVSLLGETLDFLIIDEAAMLKADIWESFLSQRLVDRKGWALFLSTPNGCNWFHALYRRGQKGRDPDFESWSSPSWMNPHLDKATVESERGRLGETVFSQEYGAEFLGAHSEPCDLCGGPSPNVVGMVVLREGEELARCRECAGAVDSAGRTLVTRWPDGRGFLYILRCGGASEEIRAAIVEKIGGGPMQANVPA